VKAEKKKKEKVSLSAKRSVGKSTGQQTRTGKGMENGPSGKKG